MVQTYRLMHNADQHMHGFKFKVIINMTMDTIKTAREDVNRNDIFSKMREIFAIISNVVIEDIFNKLSIS